MKQMTEYINKSDALAAFTTIGSVKVLGGKQCAAVISKIQNMPAADVEEITRCGACAYCEIQNNDESICHKHDVYVDNDYYCADGVKGGMDAVNEKEFIDWLVDYIFWHDEDEDLCAEVVCRKLVKIGAIKRVITHDGVFYVKADGEKKE